MDNLMPLDPPGTINPAKLSADASSVPDGLSDLGIPSPEPLIVFGAPVPGIFSSTSEPAVTASAFPRLTRITSDWEPEDEIIPNGAFTYSELRNEFEQHFVEKPYPSTITARYISHHGYFQRQTLGGINTYIPVDPDACPDSSVIIGDRTASIYDAYLLRADCTRNINLYYRQQVLFHSGSGTYTFLTREGRIGQPTKIRKSQSRNVQSLTARFRSAFRTKTGISWNRRYDDSTRLGDSLFNFVELEYRCSSAWRLGELPNYETVDGNIHEGLRELMEIMLYGGPARRDTKREYQGSENARLAFSAPYEHLSPWAIFLGFKTLQLILRYLDSGRPIRWKAILQASSMYRSQIPFCAGHDRAPVISSYHAIFLELRFLYSLWPRRELASMLADIHLRGSLQLSAYKMLAQPLYRAYSSLQHGFCRLTDPSTLEFQELKNYLERSCHRIHRLTIELQDIYSVFVKAGLPNPYRDWIEAKQGRDVSGEQKLLLWHGTPPDSLLGILDLGLQIRRRGATWTGTMFGNGIYLADASSKSATFCKHQRWDGDSVLLLCEADVGRQRIRRVQSMENGHDVIGAPGSQYRCIEGLGKIRPGGWKYVGWEMVGAPSTGVIQMPDTSVPYNSFPIGILGFNEYVVYDPSHVLIRYIFRIKVRGG
ncbi:Poly [ADP-ribose] polymerase [Madurella fahalii]|uniref:Poly [ADP-ribose] polymerase n=1 Tax=Madurella fahalii TaxID=1157608 RepID=A0ABQ0GT85_9PEZI